MIYRILSRRRLFIITLSYLIIGSYSYINILTKDGQPYFFGSTMLTSITNKTIAGIFMMIIFPLIASFLMSDIFLEDESLNLKYLWYSKYGIVKYHIINLLNIFSITFVITFLAFGFNLLLAYISFGNINISSVSFFTDYKLEVYSQDITNFDLLLKSPMKFFILKNIYISLYGAVFAQLSYLMSAFIKNKYIIIILPTLLYNAMGLVVSVLGRPGYSLYNLLYPDFAVHIRRPELINIYAVILVATNIILLLVIIKREKEHV